MGRRRLVMILAGVLAALGLQVGSVAALDAGVDASDPSVELKVGDSSAKVSGDGAEVNLGGNKDDDDSTGTKPKEETGKATGSTGSSSGGSSDGTSSGGSTSGGSTSGSSDGDTSGSSDQQDVRTAGEAESAPEASDSQGSDEVDAEEARRLLESESSDADAPDGSVEPGIELSPDGDADEPVVADPRRGAEDDWEVASPEAAEPRSDAELATVPYGSGDAVPPALKLLAAVLVTGTGTVWHLSNRRLAAVPRGLPTR